MNGLDSGERLGNEIRSEARQRAERILAAAREEADRRLSAARAAADAARDEALALAREKAAAERARIMAGMALELRRHELKQTCACLSGLADEARTRLEARSPAEADADLVRAIARGQAVLADAAARLEVSERLTADESGALAVRAGFSGSVTRVAGLAPCEAVLFSADGSRRYEIRLDAVFADGRQELYRVARDVLFGGAS